MTDITETIIGKGTWLDKIAFNIIDREKKLGRSTENINVESGLGASGIPHIGSMGDAVRAFGISQALQNLGYKSELIAFSDDFDGLRKVPHGLPKWLNEYICKPVSSIPDPFGGCHDSYGTHMSSLLLQGLDATKIKYKFKSGTEIYKNGSLSDQIHTILLNKKKIGDKIAELTGQDKYTTFLPYFPLCESCRRLYVTNAIEYVPEKRTVLYSCTGNTIGGQYIKGCGYGGEAKINHESGKLAWKVEFSARWQVFDIRFEAFGKDIMDSVRINDWVASEILKFHHPFHVKYEMFLDKGGKKISKSAGNVLTPQMWLRYGTPESLLLLLYKRISGTRHVGIEDIPLLMDEFDMYEDIYFGKISEANKSKLIKIKGIYEYINNLFPTSNNKIHIPHRVLLQQAGLYIKQYVNEDAMLIDKIFDRLIKYGLTVEKDRTNDSLRNKILLSIQWAKDFRDNWVDSERDSTKTDKIEINQDNQKNALKNIKIQLLNLIKQKNKSVYDNNLNNDVKSRIAYNQKEVYEQNRGQDSPDLSEVVQTIIFNNAKENDIPPRELFKLFYKILINSEKGPRLGNYIVDLGIQNVIDMIDNRVK